MQIKMETITPQMAKDLLAMNKNNRRLNPNTVNYYTAQIVSDKWRENGETIKIAEDGTLLDGQHRLEAIKEANKAVKMAVARNVDADTVITIDTGRSRGPADHLRIWGFKNDVNVLAAAATICMRFDKKGRWKSKTGKIPPYQIIDFVEKNKGLEKSISRTPAVTKALTSRSICVAMHYLFSSHYDPAKAELFFDAFNSGVNLKRGSPILALRNRLIEMKASRVGISSDSIRTQVIYYFVQAFKNYIDGNDVSHMIYKSGAVPDLEESL